MRSLSDAIAIQIALIGDSDVRITGKHHMRVVSLSSRNAAWNEERTNKG